MNAVLIAVVVLPSEGWLEVTRIVFGGCPADKSSEVRRCRYDSAIGDRASSIIASAVVSEGAVEAVLGSDQPGTVAFACRN